MVKIRVPWSQIQAVIGDVISGVGDGTTVSFERPSSSDAVTSEPWEGPGDPTASDKFPNIPVVGIPEEEEERDEESGITVRVIRFSVAGSDINVDPEMDWTVTDNTTGYTYSVRKVKIIRPGKVVLLYAIEASR